MVGPGEEIILETAVLAVASARHAVALCNSAAVAFEEQAAVLENCVRGLNIDSEGV